MSLLAFIISTAIANAAIGGGWVTRGVILLAWAAAIGLSCYSSIGGMWFSVFIVILLTAAYALWRSQSPRGADLDLVWDPTWDEAKNTAIRHGIPLTIIAAVSAYYSLYALLLPLLVIVPIVSHAASSKVQYLIDKGLGRRFGEFVSGGLCYGPALWVLCQAVTSYRSML